MKDNEYNNDYISELEIKVLNELQKNCRANLEDIGKKCGCSRYKIGRIIKKFEDNKTIIGYSAIINPKKINLKHYLLLVKRTNVPLDDSIIKKLPINIVSDLLPDYEVDINLQDTFYLHGNYDWISTFTADDISKAKEYANQILKYFYKFVEKVDLLETVRPIRINGFIIPHDKSVPELI
ncbi:hypothetical protein AYK24_09060 [Thermoplasmatales archaeon SG8-52-4]|nr:MAG: hypothetical protein AYK24_09060 [Thermoplasmatales archaeon SG8-52-4]